MKIKSVIFDMDGVLIDAKEWHYEALNRALRLFGTEINRYDHMVTFDGLPTKKKLELLSKDRGLPRALHDFVNKIKQQYTVELVFQHCHPIFYHEYALARLKSEGYKLAVCSNSIRNTVSLMLGRAHLDQYLEFFLSNQDVTLSKPDPEIYRVAMERLGVSPECTLVLEDNAHGIQAAVASGAHVLQIGTVEEVNYENIHKRIVEIEEGIC